MKTKLLTFLLSFFLISITVAYSQSKTDHNHNILFKYDSISNVIYTDSIIDLNRGKRHTYSFTLQTSQKSDVLITPTFTKRISATPSLLTGIVNVATTEENKSFPGKTPPPIYTYTTTNYVIRGDYTTLDILVKLKQTIKIKADTSNVLQQKYINTAIPDSISKVIQTIQFYNKGYYRYGFSSGFFFSNLTNPSFYFADSSNAHKNIQKENKPKLDISIGALFHVQYVLKSYLKVGPCIGIGVSLNDLKSKYMFGLAVTAGRKSEFTLSLGIAGSNIAHVSNSVNSPGYKVDVTKAPPTYDKWTWGYFAGISYSIFNK
jgi:hypothetical protein